MAVDAETAIQRSLGAACLLGLMHAVVDATTVTLLVWGTKAGGVWLAGEAGPYLPDSVVWNRYLLYNALAFGTQFSIGAVADRWNAYRGTLLAGLAAIAIAAMVVPFWPEAANAMAAMGNAMFHVGAGAMVLVRSPRRTVPAGIFVGPGAIGLAAGLWCGATRQFAPWLFLGPLAACACVASVLKSTAQNHDQRADFSSPREIPMVALGTGAMLLAIGLRSINGNSVSLLYEGQAGVLWALAVAACAGNIVGGVIADRFGWLKACLLGLMLSVPLLGLFVDRPAAAVGGMVLFQMTMPVTLVALSRLFPAEPGLAFGLAALAVLLGVVPVYVCPSEWTTAWPLLLLPPLVSAAAILIALPRIMPRDRPTAE
jgi:FSR family fosmidomycin resistance protein-like MFS transporter